VRATMMPDTCRVNRLTIHSHNNNENGSDLSDILQCILVRMT